jgi:hypothetical protein
MLKERDLKYIKHLVLINIIKNFLIDIVKQDAIIITLLYTSIIKCLGDHNFNG